MKESSSLWMGEKDFTLWNCLWGWFFQCLLLCYSIYTSGIICSVFLLFTLIIATQNMEHRVEDSLENYMKDPDVQANLQQLQYDLQSWNLALTTSTNMQKNMSDALKSIVSNLR